MIRFHAAGQVAMTAVAIGGLDAGDHRLVVRDHHHNHQESQCVNKRIQINVSKIADARRQPWT